MPGAFTVLSCCFSTGRKIGLFNVPKYYPSSSNFNGENKTKNSANDEERNIIYFIFKIHSKYECFSKISLNAAIDGIQVDVLFSVCSLCIYIVHMYYCPVC